eukprot:CAMPEP_0170592612 /NCGR_PEP_ID=MMETSP0224-20130122/13014_1 /TAXON_ID=285029 /ORGANISM="Togula jolla, Strain CCCM 725" /LENGTH=33 /DNA_ID= /DNA_START= /DNA_END= /DNA_ORIENTATION=
MADVLCDTCSVCPDFVEESGTGDASGCSGSVSA